MSPEKAANWEVFKENFKKRFVHPEYIDHKKKEFTQLKQKNMSAHEYYRKFTDLSRYDPDTAGNQVEMLHRFKQGTKRKWRTFASAIPCTTYHEFSEILVRMEDSENLPSNNEEDEDKNDNQRKDDRGKGPRRSGRFTGGPRFQRQIDFGGAGGSGHPLCRSCNFKHHGECRRSGGGCYTCGQMRHKAAQCSQSQQRSQQSAMPPPTPIQQNFGSGSYGQTGCGGAYHYQGDAALYAFGQNQYSQDPYFQTGYSQDPGGADWLHYNCVHIDCYGKSVTFHRPRLPEDTFVGERSGVRHGVISAIRAKKLLSKGCQGYLAHVMLNDVSPNSVEEVGVVRHYPDVFPDDLPELPPDIDVEFSIDLLPCTDPISLTPYRIAPTELRELRI
ncbi:uncharacterized protein [Malus domestica]|uniref:uncharacterized protein n=1 Tax=Malus domestica TaxID=3750 RepID=UPI003974CA72